MSNLSGFVKRLRDIMRNDAGINGDAQRIEQIAWMFFLKVYDAKEQDWDMEEKDYVSIIPEECRWQNWAVDDHTGTALTGDKLLNFVNNTLFPVLKGNDIKDGNGKIIIQGVKVDSSTPIKKAIVQTTFADANQYMKDGVLLRQVINVIDNLDLGDYEESHAFGEIYETILKELQSAGSSGEFYTPRAVTDFMAKMIEPQIGEQVADFACGTGGFLTSWLKELSKKVVTTGDQKAYDSSIYGIEKKQFPYMLCITNMLLHGIDVPKIYHDNSLLKDVLDYTVDDQFDVILMNPPYGGNEKTEVKNHFPTDLASSETADLFMSVIMYRLKKNGRAAVILPDGFLFGTDNAKVAIKKKLLLEFNLHTIIRMPHSVFAPYTSITTNILFFDHTKPTEETWFYRLDMPEGYKNFSKTKAMELKHFEPAIEWWNNREEINVDGFDKAKKYTVEEIIARNYNIDLCGYPHEEEEILPPKELIQQYQEKRASLNADIDRILAQITEILGIDLEEEE
ncbi:class I SAM-dependent DNA methyltransferase [Blautia sp. MSJ-19]|uniref:class I SAM-dependent DNA methyltransferase n=1 Tax=Blautia sp. MSJ-19 TaxID=2841517 RepID=UPI001C0EEE26|nr:class I SAM-dependent DNA methyltransferase [Blautia sp. MSJ-19]MBU5482234.1 type I restriction-modification system subunit M [Blautia sp. MSJ-19]